MASNLILLGAGDAGGGGGGASFDPATEGDTIMHVPQSAFEANAGSGRSGVTAEVGPDLQFGVTLDIVQDGTTGLYIVDNDGGQAVSADANWGSDYAAPFTCAYIVRVSAIGPNLYIYHNDSGHDRIDLSGGAVRVDGSLTGSTTGYVGGDMLRIVVLVNGASSKLWVNNVEDTGNIPSFPQLNTSDKLDTFDLLGHVTVMDGDHYDDLVTYINAI